MLNLLKYLKKKGFNQFQKKYLFERANWSQTQARRQAVQPGQILQTQKKNLMDMIFVFENEKMFDHFFNRAQNLTHV